MDKLYFINYTIKIVIIITFVYTIKKNVNNQTIIFNSIILGIVLLLVNELTKIKKIDNTGIKNEYFTDIEEEKKNPCEVEKSIIPDGNFVSYKNTKKDINSSESDKGNNIVIYPNPGKSSYVLKQSGNMLSKKLDALYNITMDLKTDRFYKASCWLSNTDDWDGNDMIFNFKIRSNQTATNERISAGKVIEKQKIGHLTWSKMVYIIYIPDTSNGKVSWYLGYKPNNQKGYRYITDISITKYYPLLEDFPVTGGLELFIDSMNKNSYSSSGGKVWKDLSSSGRDFEWKTKPEWSEDKGFTTKNNQLTGPESTNIGIIPSKSFSILFYMNINKINKNSSIFEIYGTNNIALRCSIESTSISGNNKNTIVITINNRKYKGIDIGLIKTDIQITLIKDETNNLRIYKDGTCISCDNKISVGDFELVNRNVKINPDNNLDAQLYAFLIYNRSICYDELNNIKKYLVSSKNTDPREREKKLIYSNPSAEQYNFQKDMPLSGIISDQDHSLNNNNKYMSPNVYENNEKIQQEYVNNNEEHTSEEENLLVQRLSSINLKNKQLKNGDKTSSYLSSEEEGKRLIDTQGETINNVTYSESEEEQNVIQEEQNVIQEEQNIIQEEMNRCPSTFIEKNCHCLRDENNNFVCGYREGGVTFLCNDACCQQSCNKLNTNTNTDNEAQNSQNNRYTQEKNRKKVENGGYSDSGSINSNDYHGLKPSEKSKILDQGPFNRVLYKQNRFNTGKNSQTVPAISPKKKCKPDTTKYIERSKVPCWGCNLK